MNQNVLRNRLQIAFHEEDDKFLLSITIREALVMALDWCSYRDNFLHIISEKKIYYFNNMKCIG